MAPWDLVLQEGHWTYKTHHRTVRAGTPGFSHIQNSKIICGISQGWCESKKITAVKAHWSIKPPYKCHQGHVEMGWPANSSGIQHANSKEQSTATSHPGAHCTSWSETIPCKTQILSASFTDGAVVSCYVSISFLTYSRVSETGLNFFTPTMLT